jgi:peptidoglycan/xylan/chitin deacetylase (PgdA/CDA1 family)
VGDDSQRELPGQDGSLRIGREQYPREIILSSGCVADSNMNRPCIVTTSWDDGDPCDLKMADLLRARGLAATFYIALAPEGRKTFDPERLRSLTSEGFEIGGHGVSHSVLTHLGPEKVAREVGLCKNRLEDIISERVRMFCYPKGRFNDEVIRHVRSAGYEGARTTRLFRQRLDFDPFQMPVSLFAYPKVFNFCAKELLKARNLRRFLTLIPQILRTNSWVALGKALFDQVSKGGGVWHLFGHSWEIEQLGLWDDLKEILDYVSGREGVRYVTNAEVLTFLSVKTPVTPQHSVSHR